MTEKDDKPRLFEVTAMFTQDNDSCDDDKLGQELTIRTVDAGAGHYYVIETKRWAFDKAAELQVLFERIRKFIGRDWQDD